MAMRQVNQVDAINVVTQVTQTVAGEGISIANANIPNMEDVTFNGYVATTNADIGIGETRTFTITLDDMAPTPPPMNNDVSQFDPSAVASYAPTPNGSGNTIPQFDRMKGAKWFQKARNVEVMIIGQGGIGSWLTLFMSRLGGTIYTHDMDTYEAHNMTGQLVRQTDIGKLKTTAVAEICRIFNSNSWSSIYTNAEFDIHSFAIPVMMCGLDNMDARTLAFNKWKEVVDNYDKLSPADKIYVASPPFFQDGRLTAEQIIIYNIPYDRKDLIKKYEKECLFEDKDGYEGDCTFKQTSHSAAMIASHMVGFYTNWLTNVVTKDKDYTKVPFRYEYVIPFNLTM